LVVGVDVDEEVLLDEGELVRTVNHMMTVTAKLE
jgi:hypothetical protein